MYRKPRTAASFSDIMIFLQVYFRNTQGSNVLCSFSKMLRRSLPSYLILPCTFSFRSIWSTLEALMILTQRVVGTLILFLEQQSKSHVLFGSRARDLNKPYHHFVSFTNLLRFLQIWKGQNLNFAHLCYTEHSMVGSSLCEAISL